MNDAAPVAVPEMVDLAFALEAQALPANFEWPLYRAVVRVAPWIGRVHDAGIHPLRLTPSCAGGFLVGRRAKLVVRMPRDRVCAATILEGAALDLGDGLWVKLGSGTLRPLEPSATLYSPRVTTGESDESVFTGQVAAELAQLGIPAPFLCGKHSIAMLDGHALPAFSVAVHGLGDRASLQLQRCGLGRGRSIGCGLFVPHKAIATGE